MSTVKPHAVWTDDERARLADLWRRGATWRTLAEALPRHSRGGLAAEARRQRLPPLPDGWVTVRQGARRAGYAPRAWARLLARWCVRVRPHPRPTRSGRPNRRIHAWAAAARHLATHLRLETAQRAADRLAVARRTLAYRAAAEGLRGPQTPGTWERLAAAPPWQWRRAA